MADEVRLTAAELRAALGFMETLADSADLDMLTRAVATGLSEILDGEVAWFGALSPEERTVPGHDLATHPCTAAADDRRRARRVPPPTHGADARTRLLPKVDLWVDIAVRPPLALGLLVNGGRLSDRDRTIIDLLRPHLRVAHAHARQRVRAQALHSGMLTVGQEFLLLDAGGHLVDASPGMLDRLSMDRAGTADLDALLNRADEPTERSEPAMRPHLRVVDVDPAGSRLVLLDDATVETSPRDVRTHLGLSVREAEVLAVVARGQTNAEAARELSVSPHTVKKHLERIYEKLGVRTRAAAAAVAHSSGLVGPVAVASLSAD